MRVERFKLQNGCADRPLDCVSRDLVNSVSYGMGPKWMKSCQCLPDPNSVEQLRSLAFRFQLWATHRRSEQGWKSYKRPITTTIMVASGRLALPPPAQFELASSPWVLGGYLSLCPAHARTHPHPSAPTFFDRHPLHTILVSHFSGMACHLFLPLA